MRGSWCFLCEFWCRVVMCALWESARGDWFGLMGDSLGVIDLTVCSRCIFIKSPLSFVPPSELDNVHESERWACDDD